MSSAIDVELMSGYMWHDDQTMHKKKQWILKLPKFHQSQSTPIHHRLKVAGGTLSSIAGDFVVRGEGAWYGGLAKTGTQRFEPFTHFHPLRPLALSALKILFSFMAVQNLLLQTPNTWPLPQVAPLKRSSLSKLISLFYFKTILKNAISKADLMSLSQNMNSENVDEPVSYVKIFGTFIRIGLFTLGGGLAMAAVLRHELVLNRKWVKDDDFMAEMSTATVIPGAIAVNLAYLQGLRLRGKGGAAIAVFGTILPSFSIMLLIALFAFPYFKQPKVAAFFKGCAIAVAGLLAFAGYTFGKKLLRTWSSAFVCLAGVMVVALLGVHPIWTVITTGVLGYYLYKNDST